MKYTNYIINNNIDIDGMISKKPVLKQITVLLSLPVAFVSLIILSLMIPPALVMDSGRYAKMEYYYFAKKQRKSHYINNIVASLDVPKRERNKLRNLLKTI